MTFERPAPIVFLNALRAIFCLLFAFWALPQQVIAQGGPFTCDVVFYQVRDKATPESALFKFQSVSATVTPTAVYGSRTSTITLNALGYNPVDNYMYGITAVAGTPTLVRVGNEGYQTIGLVQGLTGGHQLTGFTPTAGVFDSAGRYYFAGQGGSAITPTAVFRLDSIPTLPANMTVSFQYNIKNAAGAAVSVLNAGDFDFNGAGGKDGLLMGASRQAAFGSADTMLRINLESSNVSSFGTATAVTSTLAFPGGVPTNFGVGSALWDAATSKFYVFDNGQSTFWEISNPEGPGVGSASPVIVPVPQQPPNYSTGINTSDGTSCPISGTRRAELVVNKTDNKTTTNAGSVNAYVITVANYGPYPANYTTLRDPAAVGLTKTSVGCSASAGPPFAVCPATLSIASLEAGVTVITFPPSTTLTFTVNALVTTTFPFRVTNTFSATVANDTVESTLTNNVSVDVDDVVASTSRVSSTAAICPANTAERFTNLLSNGDFSLTTPLSSSVTVGAANAWSGTPTLPGGLSVQRQQFSQTYGTAIQQATFPGDGGRSVASADWWLLVNGLVTPVPAAPVHDVWSQNVVGLVIGRTYQFMFYASNATRPGTASTTTPDYSMVVANGSGAFVPIGGATARYTATFSANEAGTDTWTLVQGTFTAVATTATVGIRGTATVAYAGGQGKQMALAQVTLRECAPAPDVQVTKVGTSSTFVSGGTAAYTITVVNLTAGVNATNTLIVDPPIVTVGKTTITCIATVPSTCPPSLNLIDFEGSGLVIPTIVGNGTVRFVVRVNVAGAPSDTATNIVTVSSSSYSDPNLANNEARHTATIVGVAFLSVTKTNVVTTLTAGQTTSYTVTVANGGPATVIGVVLSDVPAVGLSCTAVTCTGVVGAASCPAAASVTIGALTGGGITLPSMGNPSSITFAVMCEVRATGR